MPGATLFVNAADVVKIVWKRDDAVADLLESFDEESSKFETLGRGLAAALCPQAGEPEEER
jgi:hypothetical protein